MAARQTWQFRISVYTTDLCIAPRLYKASVILHLLRSTALSAVYRKTSAHFACAAVCYAFSRVFKKPAACQCDERSNRKNLLALRLLVCQSFKSEHDGIDLIGVGSTGPIVKYT